MGSKQGATGLLRRVFKRVSNPRDSDEGYSAGNLNSEKKSQLLIYKQRNDLERKKEFDELRSLNAQRQKNDTKESSTLSTESNQSEHDDLCKNTIKSVDTLDKINQLESQMATRWTAAGASKPEGNGIQNIPLSQMVTPINDLSEMADPFLEEVAVLFASNEDDQVEQGLLELLGPESPQKDDRATWLTLMDFYRAVGKQAPYEKVALDYLTLFSESAPQWKVFDKTENLSHSQIQHSLGSSSYWAAPAILDESAAKEMEAVLLGASKPTLIMDWSALQDITSEAAKIVLGIFKKLNNPNTLLQIASLNKVMGVLADKTKIEIDENTQGEEVFWLLRLEFLRFFDTVESFDMEAMEFCLAHEVSPPSWVKPLNKTEDLDAVSKKADDNTVNTRLGLSTVVGELSTQFYGQNSQSPLNLKGAYKGSMSAVLQKFNNSIGDGGGCLTVNCDGLVRVDFASAGDLLNWLSEKAAQNYIVHFVNVHRLIALFFIVMGIAAVSQISLRKD